jgi:cysteine synthase
MSTSPRIVGPTFAEMLDPSRIDPKLRDAAGKAKTTAPLDPVNLFNISWKDQDNRIRHLVLPKALTGVDAEIVVIYGKDFPTGSHKVGATYSVLIEQLARGLITPGKHLVVWPSTGNYGIGGAWVGGRMGIESVVVLPEEMSVERFEMIRSFGARVIATPGCESNVKEIYDKCKELTAGDPSLVKVLNQFEAFGNYRFHTHVTGNTLIELADVLASQGIGDGRIAAFVSSMGSAGTIGAGDTLKVHWPQHRIVGLEPIQCPTLTLNGYGAHDIQGIGDKHVTWIHNVNNMDALICIDDMECKLGLQMLTEAAGKRRLTEAGADPATVETLSQIVGISGVCNILGAIKTAKHYGLGAKDVVATVCTDNIARYHSVMAALTASRGPLDAAEASHRLNSIFRGQKGDWIQEGTQENRARWHNLKYYTWVEQQGKTVDQLNAQRDPDYWRQERRMVTDIDRIIEQYRGPTPAA